MTEFDANKEGFIPQKEDEGYTAISLPQSVKSFSLRPAQTDDEGFLFDLYASTREEEIVGAGLDDAQKEMFLRLQFTAQQQHYRAVASFLEHQIILIDHRPAGRILVMRTEGEIRLSDIALLAEHRNRSIGTLLIRELQREALAAEKPLRLHVAHFNRAIRLYRRCGFVTIEDTGSHLFMEWKPEG